MGELFSSPGPQFVPRPPFIFWAHVSIAGSQIISDRLNVLSMIFLQLCTILLKKHSTVWIYDRKNVNFEWLINCRITIAKVANLLGPGTYVPVPAVKSNNFAAGMLQAKISGPRHRRRKLLGQAGRGPPTSRSLWAAPILGPPTF